MELYQIKYFLALCETLNFARAAERCNVSQPSLTRAVQKLEQQLGGLLVVRDRHLTHLTELGTLVRPMLSEVVSHSLRAKSVAEQHLGSKKKVLRLGYMPSIGPNRLTSLLARFSAEQPEVELALVEASHFSLSDLLLNGRLEAMVTAYVARPTSDCDTVDFIKNRSPSLRHADIASKNFKPFDCVNWRGSDFCFAPTAILATSCCNAVASKGLSRASPTGAHVRTGSRRWSRPALASP